MPVAADGFSLFVGGPDGAAGHGPVHAPAGETYPSWGWTLPDGGGTYHALFPRAWQAFEPEAPRRPARRGAALPRDRRRPRASALPVGSFDWWLENPGPAADGRADAHLAGPAADPATPALAGSWHHSIETPDGGGAILHAPAVLLRVFAGRSLWRRPASPVSL